jgi:hypothetical protein
MTRFTGGQLGQSWPPFYIDPICRSSFESARCALPAAAFAASMRPQHGPLLNTTHRWWTKVRLDQSAARLNYSNAAWLRANNWNLPDGYDRTLA